MSLRIAALTALVLGVLVSPAAAQRGQGPNKVPRGHYPPRGMCRIWFDGVPPGRQPAPTDCETAFRRAPDRARIITSDGREIEGGRYSDYRDYRRARERDDRVYRTDDYDRNDGTLKRDGAIKREGAVKSDQKSDEDAKDADDAKRDGDEKPSAEKRDRYAGQSDEGLNEEGRR